GALGPPWHPASGNVEIVDLLENVLTKLTGVVPRQEPRRQVIATTECSETDTSEARLSEHASSSVHEGGDFFQDFLARRGVDHDADLIERLEDGQHVHRLALCLVDLVGHALAA